MRTLTLDLCNTVMLDSSEPIVLPDGLEFEIKSNSYKLGTLVVTAKNGNKVKKIKLTDKYTFDLKELEISGKISLEISSVISGRVVKTWRVPDLILVEVEHVFMAIPEIEALKMQFNAEIGTLKTAIKELNEKIEKQGV